MKLQIWISSYVVQISLVIRNWSKLKFNFRYLGLPIYWGWLADPDLAWPLLPHSHPSTSLIAIDDPQQSTSSCYQHSLPAVNIVMYQQSTPLCGQTTGARGRRVLTSPHSFMFHNKSFSNNDFLSCVVSVNTGYLHIYINNLPPSSTKIVIHSSAWAECLTGTCSTSVTIKCGAALSCYIDLFWLSDQENECGIHFVTRVWNEGYLKVPEDLTITTRSFSWFYI